MKESIKNKIQQLRQQELETLNEYKIEINEQFADAQAKTLFIFGKNIREIRRQRALSQEDVARLTGFSRTSITNMENALQDITLTGVIKFCIAFNCEIADLMPLLKDIAFKTPMGEVNGETKILL